jgi:hypothetical protein
MFVVIHRDHDSEESADFWHWSILQRRHPFLPVAARFALAA